MTSSGSGLIKRGLFTLVLFFFFIGLLESLLRVLFPVPEIMNFNRITYSPLLFSPKNSRDYLSNTAFTWSSELDGAEFVHNLNMYGFRDKNWRFQGIQRDQSVLFVGNSFVEGFMATDKETIPEGFRLAASAKSHFTETLNLGIGAVNVPEYFMLIRDALPLFQPGHLFLIFYANDFADLPEFDSAWLHGSFVPEVARWTTPRIFYLIKSVTSNKKIPCIRSTPCFSFIAPVPDPRNPWSLKENAARFEQFVDPKIADAMKRGRFNPYAVNSYVRRKDSLRKPFVISSHLKALKLFLGKHSCRLFIAYIPSCHQVSDAYLHFHSQYSIDKNPTSLMGEEYQVHAKILKDTCRRLNIPFFDMTSLLRTHETEGERLYWNYDSHMKGKSYLLVGEYLFNWFEHELKGK